ncbi:MAG: tetratricopeptide repeat protein, partial [Syntrophobacteraceae bacterium]
ELERFEEAEAAYRKTIELEPNYTWAWVQLGQLLHDKLARFEEAEAAYRKAIELGPSYNWAWSNLGRLLHQKLGRYEEAEAAYRKAIELEPKYYWPWVQLGLLLHEKLERFVEAEGAYRKAIELDPRNNWAWAQLGRLMDGLGSTGQWKDALDIASRSLAHTASPQSHVGQLTDFFINAAASGYAEEVLTSLQKNPGASVLEPLVAGLQIFLGEEPVIAQELGEFGASLRTMVRPLDPHWRKKLKWLLLPPSDLRHPPSV